MAANRPVLLVGDSHVAGAPGRALVALIGDPTERLAVEGWGPSDWLRFDPDVLMEAIEDASEVIFWFGTNDPPSQTEAAFRELRQLAPNSWLIGPPQYADPARDAWSSEITRQGRRIFGTRFVNSRWLTERKEGRAADGTHFTEAGGIAWAEKIASRISFQRLMPMMGSLAGAIGGAALVFWWCMERSECR